MTEYRKAFEAYLRTGHESPELRAMGEGGASGTTGAFLFPDEFQGPLAVKLQSYGSLFRDMRMVNTAHGRPMHVPVRSVQGAGSVIEENTVNGSSDTDATFAESKLYAFLISSGLNKVSIPLEEDAAFPMQDVVSDWASEAIGRKLATLSVSGTGTVTDDGNGQPQGVVTALNAAGSAGTVGSAITATGGFVTLSAARNAEVDGATVTELTGNVLSVTTLRALIAAVDPAYYLPDADGNGGCKWYVQSLAQLTSLTDTTGQPLIRPNGPLELWGFPIQVAPELPTLTLSTTGGITFANMSKAFYLRSAGFLVTRLRERFADVGAAGYSVYGRFDVRVRDVRAACTVKAAAT